MVLFYMVLLTFDRISGARNSQIVSISKLMEAKHGK